MSSSSKQQDQTSKESTVQGEGDYRSAERFNKKQREFVKSDSGKRAAGEKTPLKGEPKRMPGRRIRR